MTQTGDAARGFFVIQKGLARVYRSSEQGRELSLVLLEAGSIYGESCLFGNSQFTENVFVLKPLEAYFMPKEPFLKALGQDPQLSLALAKSLTRTMQKVINSLDQNTTLQASDRIIQFLNGLRQKQQGAQVVLPVPKKEVALQLGMSPETFSRELRKLEDDALIRVDRRAIHLGKRFCQEHPLVPPQFRHL